MVSKYCIGREGHGWTNLSIIAKYSIPLAVLSDSDQDLGGSGMRRLLESVSILPLFFELQYSFTSCILRLRYRCYP